MVECTSLSQGCKGSGDKGERNRLRVPGVPAMFTGLDHPLRNAMIEVRIVPGAPSRPVHSTSLQIDGCATPVAPVELCKAPD